MVLGAVTISALSGALFNLGPIDFVGLGSAGRSGWSKSGDPHSKMVTLKELIEGAQFGSGISINNAIKANIKANGVMAIGAVLGVTAASAVAKKVGVYKTLNKIVRSAGLGKVVKF